ncbi:MAG: YihY/virulence factor BrkB family protein [Coriobacteriia bacterium]|nr:YihY/virulence factor BrkB family protein [Coriobacteriia bacterium]MBN2848235.1 YihY/virulence factor BrkB family protein [Coriobacteriia bacterium]
MPTATLDLLRRTYDEWRIDGAPHIAAALTYYTLLSVAPLLVVLVGVIGRYVGRPAVADRVLGQAEVLAGPLGTQVATELITAAQPTTTSSVASFLALVLAVFGAMRVFGQLRTAFDRMWNIPPEKTPDGDLRAQIRHALSAFGRHNLAAFLMVLAVGVLLIASVVLSSVLAVAAERLAPYLDIGPTGLRALEGAASLVLITALFAIVYRFLPRTAIGWKDVWIGAAITAVLFTLGRVLLGVYFTYASPGSAYGAAGSVVALLVWVNFSSQLALFGAEFTYVWTYTHGSRAPDALEQ